MGKDNGDEKSIKYVYHFYAEHVTDSGRFKDGIIVLDHKVIDRESYDEIKIAMARAVGESQNAIYGVKVKAFEFLYTI